MIANSSIGRLASRPSATLLAALLALAAAPVSAQRLAPSAFQTTSGYVAAVSRGTSAECVGVSARRPARFLAGAAGAAIVGMTAWKVVDDPYGTSRRVKGDEGYTPNANTAYAIGSWLGSAVFSYLVAPRECRSLPAQLLATAIPSSVLLFGRNEPYLPLMGLLFAAPLQGAAGALSR